MTDFSMIATMLAPNQAVAKYQVLAILGSGTFVPGSGMRMVPFDPNGVEGANMPRAVAKQAVTSGADPEDIVVWVRGQDARGTPALSADDVAKLVWLPGTTADQIATALESLKAQKIIPGTASWDKVRPAEPDAVGAADLQRIEAVRLGYVVEPALPADYVPPGLAS